MTRVTTIAVLEETRAPVGSSLPQGSPSPSLVSSSAAAAEPCAPVRVDPAQGLTAVPPSGPSPVAALTSAKLRSLVATARQHHGPHRARWENRQRRAWQELARRGQAA